MNKVFVIIESNRNGFYPPDDNMLKQCIKEESDCSININDTSFKLHQSLTLIGYQEENI
jgi:hypothetical protein